MVGHAAADGQSSIAITDHGNLFGVLEFAREARKQSIRPIIGIEAYVAPGSRHDKGTTQAGGARQKPYHHLILLAESYVGYKNLIKLSTAGFLEGFYYRPRIDKELLREHNEGIVCLSACLAGEVPTLLLRADRYDDAAPVAAEFRDLFGPGRYWLELQDHGIDEQEKVNAGSVRLGQGARASASWRRTTATTCCRPTTSRTTSSSASRRARRFTLTTGSATRRSTT